MSIDGKRILLIVSGGIAAYKSLDLIRRLRERGATVHCVLTAGGAQFITPLSLAALSENPVHQDIFSLTEEAEMGHIRLSREADLLVVAPATADLLAKMAAGLANDLASTLLLATDKPVLVAPSMNVLMWTHAATQENMATLERRGICRVGPARGDLACGETGDGRLAEIPDILEAIDGFFRPVDLAGRHLLVTSGPTIEPIDPVRFIANRSSGKQGHAIAQALAQRGARVTLVSGPVALPDPRGVTVVRVETAGQMLAACQAALPADGVVCAAAVADWTVADAAVRKCKKEPGAPPPTLTLTLNPDILATLAAPGPQRPPLVIGFAAETESLIAYAQEKLRRKACDLILANDVSAGSGTFGGDSNAVHLVSAAGVESWPRLGKVALAERLAALIATRLASQRQQDI